MNYMHCVVQTKLGGHVFLKLFVLGGPLENDITVHQSGPSKEKDFRASLL